MKFLADMGVSPLTVQVLRQQGYDAIHLYEERLEKLADRLILEKAKQEERIVLTFDLDFGDLLAASSAPLPSVVIFRLQETKPIAINERLLSVLQEYCEDLQKGAIVIIEDTRCRSRRLPIE